MKAISNVPDKRGGTETILTGITSSNSDPNYAIISFTYSFPHNIQSVKLKRIICLGIPPIEINEFCTIDSTTSSAYFPYYQATDSTLISNIHLFATLAEIEITYS